MKLRTQRKEGKINKRLRKFLKFPEVLELNQKKSTISLCQPFKKKKKQVPFQSISCKGHVQNGQSLFVPCVCREAHRLLVIALKLTESSPFLIHLPEL
jgi:hypothetical protein